jgi:hypothetical protein
MYLLHPQPLGPVFLLVALLVAGCGGKEAETDSAETATAEEAEPKLEASAPAPPAEPAGNATSAPVTTEDVARWEKGMDAEMQSVRAAGEQLKSARTSADTVSAMMGVQEMATLDTGAKAAGLERERYRFVRSRLSAIVGYLTPSLGGIDTTMLTAAQRDELRQGNEAQIQRMQQEVPPEVVAAIKPRAVELRTKSMELVGARLKAAGM